ncbi:epoxide hydrolase A [Capsicum annuum]|uniref:epoxide hydrolase A n=1 Tax=Capsicum annuum TaxID=4072 RepID=UPI001FB06E13|nr:epoxide hydrolase A [Capsicum annuum]
MEIKFHFVHDRVRAKTLSVRYVSSHDQVIHALTKPFSNVLYLDLKRKLTIVPLPTQLEGVCKDNEYGEVEEEFARVDTARLIAKFLTSRNPAPLRVPKEKGFGGSPHTPIKLPSWLSEEDLEYYTNKFRQTGFTGGLNYYRAMDLNWELTAPWTGVQIQVPVKFIVGDVDLTYNTPGVKEYIHKGGFRKMVPFLQEVVIMEGVAHFINQEKPEEINDHIYDFFQKF